jgi:uncharacterized membrane protein (UPF0127 family)
MRLHNLTRGEPLAERLHLADRFWWRLRGLIGRRFGELDGAAFPRCNAIHTCFMGMAIDVLFVGTDGEVRKVCHAVPPWRLAGARGARWVAELPAGTLARTGTQPGDRVALAP